MGVYEQQLNEGFLLSKLPPFKRKVAKALEDISACLNRYSPAYCSVSWGKDSIVLAHLIACVDSSIPLVHWPSDQEESISNFGAVKADYLANNPCNYIVLLSDDLMEDRLRNIGKAWSLDNNYNAVFMGLTADESKARKYALGKADANNIYTYTDGFARCCPLKNWSILDIAAYVASRKLKMLDIYERYGFEARTSSRIKQSGFTRNGLDYLSSTQQYEVKQKWRS